MFVFKFSPRLYDVYKCCFGVLYQPYSSTMLVYYLRMIDQNHYSLGKLGLDLNTLNQLLETYVTNMRLSCLCNMETAYIAIHVDSEYKQNRVLSASVSNNTTCIMNPSDFSS